MADIPYRYKIRVKLPDKSSRDADIPYRYKIRVKLPDKSSRDEDMTVSERNSAFGSAMALGKVVRYYDSLKAYKEILDYRIMVG